MLLVRRVSGPAAAEVGEAIVYRVTGWSRDEADPQQAAQVSWLVKTPSGAELLHRRRVGPVLELEVPSTWSGRRAVVMPYMRSPTARVSAETEIAERPPVADGPKEVRVEREGRRLYASIDGEPRFYVGSDVRYGTRRGLMNSINPPGEVYLPSDWEGEHGHWAWLLYPTIHAESRGFFTCLNTYDRARFTFGHLQLAAHTPNDNFVAILRRMLELPLAAAYFPDLALAHGRVHQVTPGGLMLLEDDRSTGKLQHYLNPGEHEVDEVETERAARIVDWCVRDPALRRLNVAFTVEQQRRKLAYYSTRLPLDGVVDKLVLVVLDALHQGRASFRSLRRALEADDPLEALLTLGASTYRERIATLRAALRELETAGKIGRRVYSQQRADFVLPRGA